MQNRYTCDVGDFAKYGLMRSFHAAGFRTALAWYLSSDEGHNSDGKHIAYLGFDEFRRCDPKLYDQLKTMVDGNNRHISAIEGSKILGADTLFHSELLDFNDLPSLLCKAGKHKREERRKKWLSNCKTETKDAEVAFFDPDNGIAGNKPRPLASKGPKFLYWSDLDTFIDREQSLVIYNHASRNGTVYNQITSRLSEIKGHVPYGSNAFAMLWRRYSVRYFLVIPTDDMKSRISSTCDDMIAGPWGQGKFFELVKK
ncbi:MAG: hypothetical protein CBB68_03395 [Rhodospirillaceae bacterium TMED8]|nr:hypothetical protein [Magnetovibrio sp.]OUT51933.1 MAG: hypothetical protein CBB68_03395 [Rhodospirillaceae bacterium TMED8]